MKVCTKCKRELDESCFTKRGDTKDGLSYICRDCKRKYDKAFDERKRQGEKSLKDSNSILNSDFKIRICEKCGKEFKVGRKPSKPNDFLIRKYCPDCDTLNQDYKTVYCKKCGKPFKVERTPDGRHFKHQSLCKECSKPAEFKIKICERCGKEFKVDKYPGTNSFRKIRFCSSECAKVVATKKAICECCGKEFYLERTEDNHFIQRKYCSKECRLKVQRQKLKEKQEETLNKIRKTCQEKYGVDYPCQTTNCINSNPLLISKTNENFAVLLEKHNINYEFEFVLGNYSYDFYLLDYNVLVEIDPTFTHTCFDTGVYEPKDKYYHHNKTKYALSQGYKCVHIYDWNDWDSIINSITQPFELVEKDIDLHWSKNKIVVDNIEDYDKLFEQGYLPIFDDGYKIV